MKVFRTIMKIVAALAVAAGIVYVLATYGNKIVAWCKKLLDKVNDCCCGGTCCCGDECCCDDDCCDANTVEEVVSAEINPPEEAPADESDFETE